MWLKIVARSPSKLFVLLSLKYSPPVSPAVVSGMFFSSGDCGYLGEQKWWRKKAETVPELCDRLFIEVDLRIVRVAAHTTLSRARWLRTG
jgi:hypothetical protein